MSTSWLTVESAGINPDCKLVNTEFVRRKLKTCLCMIFSSDLLLEFQKKHVTMKLRFCYALLRKCFQCNINDLKCNDI